MSYIPIERPFSSRVWKIVGVIAEPPKHLRTLKILADVADMALQSNQHHLAVGLSGIGHGFYRT